MSFDSNDLKEINFNSIITVEPGTSLQSMCLHCFCNKVLLCLQLTLLIVNFLLSEWKAGDPELVLLENFTCQFI